MTFTLLLLSLAFVFGFLGVALKPSPIYGGLGLILSGGVGCGIVLYFGGSFLGLMVFLVYLGGMLVVFGYTTAMATEEYPETWNSDILSWSILLSGIILEIILILLMEVYDGVEVVINFNGLEDWVLFETDDVGLVREDSMGVAALYSYGSWLVVVAGWSLFVSIFIAIEITRGN
uniref:NADH-ubiquinone oxidoreductase chain 6 n=1 Tax=Eliomys quercinus TaxID=53277 RepID=A0A8A3WKU0_ELIQU|nr:NADH dehydrogenase subunit 6 [Eliomys quercinus]QTA72869.1 NADH dehydrogenase subunit 6 [Eliomys quercinus]